MPVQEIFARALSFDIPPQWSDMSTYSFVAPEEQLVGELPTLSKMRGFRPNVVLVRQPRGDHWDAQSFSKASLDEASKQVHQLKVVEERGRKVAGIPAWTRTVTFSAPNGVVAQQLQVFFLLGEFAHTLVFSSVPELWGTHVGTFEQILESFVQPL